MPRNATHSEDLTPQQQRALEALLAGQTVTAAANTAGVDRSTVHRWQKDDLVFRAAFNRGRRELLASVRTRLLALTERAVACVERELDGGDARTAMALLKGLGLLGGQVTAIGSDDPEELRRNEEERRRNAERSEQVRAYQDMLIDTSFPKLPPGSS